MSIKIFVEMERDLTERISGTFTTNHTEDEVRKWIDSGGLDYNSLNGLLGDFYTTNETSLKTSSFRTEPYVKGEKDFDFKFDDDIQDWKKEK